MKVAAFIIERFANWRYSSQVFKEVQDVVKAVEENPPVGMSKKDFVMQELEDVGVRLTGFAFNALIELAVLWLNAYLGKSIFKLQNKE